MNVNDDFDAIARANPDLAGEDVATVNLRRGDEIASLPLETFEALGTEIGEAILAGTDVRESWGHALQQPALMAEAIAEGGYRYAVLRAFALPPLEARRVLERAGAFLQLIATK